MTTTLIESTCGYEVARVLSYRCPDEYPKGHGKRYLEVFDDRIHAPPSRAKPNEGRHHPTLS